MKRLAVLLTALALFGGACRVTERGNESLVPPPYPSSTPNMSSVGPPTSVSAPGKAADAQASPQAATPIAPLSRS